MTRRLLLKLMCGLLALPAAALAAIKQKPKLWKVTTVPGATHIDPAFWDDFDKIYPGLTTSSFTDSYTIRIDAVKDPPSEPQGEWEFWVDNDP